MKKIIFCLLLVALLTTVAVAETCTVNADCESGYKCVDGKCTKILIIEKLDSYLGKTVSLEDRVPSGVKKFSGMVLPMNVLLNVTDKNKIYLIKIKKNYDLSINGKGDSYDLEVRTDSAVVEKIGTLTSYDLSSIKNIIENENIVLLPESSKGEFLLTQAVELLGIKPEVERKTDIISVIVHGFSVIVAKIISFFNSIFHFIPAFT